MSSDPEGPNPTVVDEAELQALVDGCLPEHRRAEVLAWVESDPDRRERVAAYRKQRQLLAEIRSHLGAFDTVGFEPDLQRQLIEGLERRQQRRQVTFGVAGLAAAIALTVVGTFAYVHYPQSRVGDVPVAATEATEFPFGGTFVTPVSTVAAGANGEASISWLSQRLAGDTVHLPDLSEVGLHLTAAGVLPGPSAPAIRLVYGDDKDKRIFLYIGGASSSTRQAFTMMPEGQLSLHWRHGHLLFALIGSVDSPKLLDIMRLVSDENAPAPTGPVLDVPRPVDKQALDRAIQPVVMPTDTATAANLVTPITGPADAKAVPAPLETAPTAPAPVKIEQPKPL